MDEESASSGRIIPLGDFAGRVVEDLPPGPGLAGWLSATQVERLDEYELAGVAAACRRLASWATAAELSTVAEMAARSAARNTRIPSGPDGRPAQISEDAAAGVALALTMSRFGGTAWATLAATLRWRLPRTLGAMTAGRIDLPRARLIAEATDVLDDEDATAVEDRVLDEAERQTTGQLRASLRRAVISVDPAAAERRREDAERRARIGLYADEEGTATLAGHNLPGGLAAAAMARVTALAQAMKAAGAGGGMDLLRAQVFIGLLLNTLPGIPPATEDPAAPGPQDPGNAGPGPQDPGPQDPGDASPGSAGPGSAGPGSADPAPAGMADSGPPSRGPSGRPTTSPGFVTAQGPAPPPPAPERGSTTSRSAGAGDQPAAQLWDGPWAGIDGPWDEDIPVDLDPRDEDRPLIWPQGHFDEGADEWLARAGPAPPWPPLPTQREGPPVGGGTPVRGRVAMIVPWRTLAGLSPEPGSLCWLGPMTPAAARELAASAAASHATEWRVIVTTANGQVLCVTKIRVPPRRGYTDRIGRPGSRAGSGSGLISRITLILPADVIREAAGALQASGALQTTDALENAGAFGASAAGQACQADPDPGGSLADVLVWACDAARRALGGLPGTDTLAAGEPASGCSHSAAGTAYRPPGRLREFIVARDQTCRFPGCRQPAWQTDLDHTIPYDRGGPTCSCNLGAACRAHHQVKQLPGWRLTQPEPGTFDWSTPAGRHYRATPDTYPV